MNRLLYCLIGLFVAASCASAQPAIPAKPVDPSQARPALPVTPEVAAPAQPTAPAAAPAPAPTAAVSVTVFAESSLKLAIAELAQAWADSQETSPQMPLTLTNSGTLRSKVASGAACDVFISADVNDVKAMTDQGLLFGDGQRSLARNVLVIYGRKPLVKDDELEWFDLIGSEWKKIALGKPDQVASGRVAQRALQKHGLLNDDNKDSFSYGVTDALVIAVVQREQVDAAFLLKTDAMKLNLRGYTTVNIKSDDAPPLFYTAAVCRASKNPALARAFIDYCSSEAAKPIWSKFGFETN